ncbi:PstS family phosphate ABC transporter substrate-binding protein [Bacteroidota bacterium]
MTYQNNIKLLLITLLVVPMFLTGCKKKDDIEKLVLTVKGSDTMVNLSQKWAEEYMKKFQSTSIQITGGGSGTGIAALLNGTTDLANASRDMKSKEVESLKAGGFEPIKYEVALDGIAIIVHPDNKIEEVTVEQLSRIFTGRITNWKEVGGSDMAITLYGRENSSGTYEFFKEHVLGKDERGVKRDFATTTQVLQGTAALGEAVARDSKGIGYGGVGYFVQRNDVKILKVKADEDAPAIAPAENGKVNYESIWSGDYSISRYLYCISTDKSDAKVRDFINYILSEEGQKLVENMEYIPLPKK